MSLNIYAISFDKKNMRFSFSVTLCLFAQLFYAQINSERTHIKLKHTPCDVTPYNLLGNVEGGQGKMTMMKKC